MQIKINNLDTNFSIDTYQIFTGDNVYDMEIEYQRDENNKENIDINFDHKQVVRDLALQSIETILSGLNKYENIKCIINGINLIDTFSPSYYNYTTDSYDMIIDFNSNNLNKWIKDENKTLDVNELLNKWSLTGKENEYCAKVIVFINEIVDKDSYNIDMWESETEIYYDNILISENV